MRNNGALKIYAANGGYLCDLFVITVGRINIESFSKMDGFCTGARVNILRNVSGKCGSRNKCRAELHEISFSLNSYANRVGC